MLILKILLIASAGIALIARLFAYNNADVLSSAVVSQLNMLGLIAASVCLICGIILGLILKKKQKNESSEFPDTPSEENGTENVPDTNDAPPAETEVNNNEKNN